MDEHDRVSDDDIDRLWAALSDELSSEERAQLDRDLTARPELRIARERIAAAQRDLIALDQIGPIPDIAAPVVARLAARPVPVPMRRWLWLAPLAQIVLAAAALAWALPGLLTRVTSSGWMAGATLLDLAAPIVGLQAAWVGWLDQLETLSRTLLGSGLDVSGSGTVWLGVCVAVAVVGWLAGNSVLLATRSLRR